MVKSFTDIEQSKKLAEILPIESADMCYGIVANNPNDTHEYFPYCFRGTLSGDIPCWSLSALLDIMPSEVDDNHFLTIYKEGDEYCCCYADNNDNSFRHEFADNPIDASYKMIIKLHEDGLL